MSKSKGNVINPDDVIEEYGADSLRLYELFMGPFDQEKPWNTKGLVGVRRFLEKVWRLSEKISEKKPSQEELVVLHKLIKKVGDDTPELKFNTSIAAMMEAVNAWSEQAAIAKDTYLTFLSVLNPYAPHITEELWEQQKGDGFCSLAQWPTFHSEYIQEDTVEYVIQVNGKVRARITLPAGSSETVVMEAVLADAKIKQNLQGKKVRKHIFVPDRLVSLVV
jgi:leucyl-tRNA synthetase